MQCSLPTNSDCRSKYILWVNIDDKAVKRLFILFSTDIEDLFIEQNFSKDQRS